MVLFHNKGYRYSRPLFLIGFHHNISTVGTGYQIGIGCSQSGARFFTAPDIGIQFIKKCCESFWRLRFSPVIDFYHQPVVFIV